MRNQITFNVCRINKIGHAKIRANLGFVVVQINANDLIRTGKTQALNDIQPNSAQPKDHTACANLNLGRVDDRTNPSCHTTANVANLVKRCIFSNLGKRDFGHNSVVGECRAAHVVVDRRAIQHGKTCGAVRQKALPLRDANLLAQVRFTRQAVRTFTTFWRIKRYNVITRL